MHYYSFHIGDYRSATSHLSNNEDLAYRRLLDMYYDTEKPIPLDTQWVARRIRIDHEVVLNVLSDMFEQREDGFYQDRCEHEIGVYKGFSEAGKRGAAKRWSKGGYSPPITPPIATNNHKPRTNNQQPVNTPEGVSQSVWQEFVNHRKAKKAQVTQLVIDGIQAEANKAGFTLEDALKEIVVRNWQGFKADWVADKQNSSETVYQRSMRLKMQQAVPDIAAKQPTQYEDAVEFFRTIEVPAKQIGESK